MIKNVLGGYLLQDRDQLDFSLDKCQIVTKRKPSEEEVNALKLGWKLVKYVKSNAIVFSNQHQLLSVGAGQMSRVDSVKNAIRKISETGLSLNGAVMASDAFFPFSDCLEIAAKAGIKSVIQPGGSIKDSEVINTADELDLSMLFTKARHFYH
jgi:phosphoribosylaminoimidazolecarboxamide formyltransferase/IMP cyclohydrolase